MGRKPRFEGAPPAKLPGGKDNPEYAKLPHVREKKLSSFRAWHERNHESVNARRREKYRLAKEQTE